MRPVTMMATQSRITSYNVCYTKLLRFQICTLKHSDSTTQKRQEVGRGLRLAVNQHGDRMDLQTCGERVHNINMLTVIASESYRQFVTDLQKKIKEDLYDRPSKATQEYFIRNNFV